MRLRLGLALAMPLGLAACQAAVLDPQGPIGSAERSILIGSLVIMLAIVLPTLAATFGVAFWYRKSNTRARYLPDWSYSGQLELIVWGLPLLVIMLLGGVAWIGSHQLDPGQRIASPTPALEIQGVSLDWKWLFIYPDQHVAAVNQLVIPAGVPVHFSLTSGSVMNAFFIPQLGSMIYTMGGMSNQLNLQADKPGTYYGMSSHFSGDGFADMHFDVRSVPAEQFAGWIADARKSGPALTDASYAELAKQSQKVPPSTYREVDQGLYDRIVGMKLPPAPGPDTSTPRQAVFPGTEK